MTALFNAARQDFREYLLGASRCRQDLWSCIVEGAKDSGSRGEAIAGHCTREPDITDLGDSPMFEGFRSQCTTCINRHMIRDSQL